MKALTGVLKGAVLLAGQLAFSASTSAQVERVWTTRYDGGGTRETGASDLFVDSGGNVYVTGSAKNPASELDDDWDLDYMTLKYDAAGNLLWAARYDGPEGVERRDHVRDMASAVAVDGDGNVYVTGFSFGPNSLSDWATVKYDADGNELWVQRYNNPRANGYDGARSVAVDGDGNVYVTGDRGNCSGGRCSNSPIRTEYLTVKYDFEGNELWMATYGGPAGGTDRARALAVDTDGNVYVTGSSQGLGGFGDYTTVKYDPGGGELWVARYDSGAGDTVRTLAIGRKGNVYVTGSSGRRALRDYATVIYSPEGEEISVMVYDGPANDEDFATSIVVDDDSNVYVTGGSLGSHPTLKPAPGVRRDLDYATVKYSPQGEVLWTARYDNGGTDYAGALAIDEEGRVYVTGSSESSGQGTEFLDYATVLYSSAGEELSVLRYDGPASGWDSAVSLVVDDEANVHVAGFSRGPEGTLDFATLKYAPVSPFLRGDVNADGAHDITDGIFLLNFLFLGGGQPPCSDAADFDDSAGLNISDAVGILSFVFRGGAAPLAPSECGFDPTDDDLGCISFAACP